MKILIFQICTYKHTQNVIFLPVFIVKNHAGRWMIHYLCVKWENKNKEKTEKIWMNGIRWCGFYGLADIQLWSLNIFLTSFKRSVFNLIIFFSKKKNEFQFEYSIYVMSLVQRQTMFLLVWTAKGNILKFILLSWMEVFGDLFRAKGVELKI